ncbi:Cation transport regulator ChaC [Desulfurobacterium pacificum]|uniref:Cation transport regulator ChaC n=1 Tax=Desulfurobacterium pacificum TaxID=240166 RepID=A0ABY1NJD8_9BACT|nr:gamma-glutamylcyclotransferase family protein [Desulfurobacterium pacificum]SMP11314.1 Cation transport regulator ChaC [Desulfurobacterium pacificum]
MKYYFAYGSNMNPERMKDRGADFKSLRRAILKGYKLVFNKKSKRYGGCANIEPDENAIVEGVLYELKEPEIAIKRLDFYEGYPENYDRVKVTVETEDGEKIKAFTYIAQPRYIDSTVRPSKRYLAHLLKACELGLLSPQYCEKIKRLEETL